MEMNEPNIPIEIHNMDIVQKHDDLPASPVESPKEDPVASNEIK